VVLSKRKLIQLVERSTSTAGRPTHVRRWSGRDGAASPPRASACSPSDRVAKADSWIEFSVLEDCMREHLNEVAPRRTAVLDPVSW